VSFTLPDAGSTPVTCGAFCAMASDEKRITPARIIHRLRRFLRRSESFLLLVLGIRGFGPPAERVAIFHLTQGRLLLDFNLLLPSLTMSMPVPPRKTRDGTAATKPSSLVGGEFCRSRPFLGRAAVRRIQNQTESREGNRQAWSRDFFAVNFSPSLPGWRPRYESQVQRCDAWRSWGCCRSSYLA
jgi:hypothetical protein